MQVMEDYWRWSTCVEREVRDHGGFWSSIIRRQLGAPIERAWAAWTDPEKIPLWFGKPSSISAE
jgi:hypothetical protein